MNIMERIGAHAGFVTLAALLSVALPAPAQTLKPHHAQAQLQCVACHGAGAAKGQLEPPETAACLACHGDRSALIKRTAHTNKVVEEKDPATGRLVEVVKDTNPHSGHHDRGRLDCTECHREHLKSTNLCALCHDTERLMKPTP